MGLGLRILNFVGASGEMKFDKEGCVDKQPKLWKVTKDGFQEMS
jgi:hypothetical protein